ncbi:MAG: extracellular solute-binding protein [Limnochordales bacterium]|nr:extracellular solute-binding protein [Limnochordales bacterium]
MARRGWAVLGATLLACGLAASALLPPSPVRAATSKPIVIEHWQHSSPARNAVLEKLAEEFNKRNPDIRVKLQFYELSEYFTKVTTALATGLGPDVFQVRSGNVPVYWAAKALQPLDEKQVTAAQIEKEFVPAAIYHFKHEGKYYALPVDAQTIVMFYNIKVLEEAGIDTRRPPQTWDQVVEYARKIYKKDASGQTRIEGVATGGYGPVLGTLMIQAGATLWNKTTNLPDFSTPQAAAGFQFAVDLVIRHKVEDPGMDRWRAFRNDQLGMVWAHPAMIGSFRTGNPVPEFGIEEAPAAQPGGTRASLMTNWALVISKKAPQEAATRWIRFVTSPEATLLYFASSGDLPLRQAELDRAEYITDPLYRPVIASVKAAVPAPWVTPRLWDELLRKAWQLVTGAGWAPAQAMSWLHEQAIIAEKAERSKTTL